MSIKKQEIYKAMIEDLDAKFIAGQTNQQAATGNQNQVFGEVGKRMSERRTYEIERDRLVKLMHEAEGPSPAVAAFIGPQDPPASKFDLDNGTDKIDTSLQPLGGKQI